MEPLVSVIIPVYNVAPYLREALDSVIHQTYHSLQILIIDDGSTDGSSSICDEYLSDPRVIVIHQENRGLSNARNVGLDLMTGEYTAFLDSDDAFHPTFIESLFNIMIHNHSDIVVCKYSIHNTIGRITVNDQVGKVQHDSPKQKQSVYDRVELLRALIDGKINMGVWNKLYKRKLWDGIRFPDGHNFEDIDTLYRIFDICDSAYVTEQILYFYRQRPGSITQTMTRQNLNDRILACSHLDEFVQAHTSEIFSRHQLEKIHWAALNSLIVYYAKQSSGEYSHELRKEILSTGKKNRVKNCGIQTKAAYYMIRFCPWLFKILYPIYLPLRLFVWKVIGK